ncbi:MAG: hypothetical protein Fur003_5580 [Candidatus Dojkabacteria bacterium]
MTFYRLYTNLRKLQDQRTYPYDYQLPDKIFFTPEFWKQVITLYKATRSDEHERAISVFWADGDLIFSSVVRGTTSSVTPSNQVDVKYDYSRYKGYLTKRVYVDGDIVIEKDIYYKNVPKKIEVKYLFNMHTHPPHQYENGTYYSFFSLQDIKSLLGSGAVITGMIGDKLWLLIRTVKSPSDTGTITEPEINMESLYERLHIVTYYGDFNAPLTRFRPYQPNSSSSSQQ